VSSIPLEIHPAQARTRDSQQQVRDWHLEQPNVQWHNHRLFQECPGLAEASSDRNRPYLTDKVVGLISTAGACKGCKRLTPWSSWQPPTKADAAKAETEITPLSDEEAKIT
jgi:hypothetical protein